MEIYIIRHGKAIEPEGGKFEDGFRYLSPEGRERSLLAGKKLKELGTKFEVILSSPLVRAVQTAEIIASALDFKGEVITVPELSGGGSFSRFIQLIGRYTRFSSIGIFGHSPDVNKYTSELVKNSMAAGTDINFKTCSVCRIEYSFETKSGKIIWFLDSDQMQFIKLQGRKNS